MQLRQTLQHKREIQAELVVEQRAKEQTKKQLATAQNGLTEVTRKHQMTERKLHVALDQVAQLMKKNAELKNEMEELKVRQSKLYLSLCISNGVCLDTALM